MYTSTVKIESKLGKDYLVTDYYKDGVWVKSTVQSVSAINVLEQKNHFTFLKNLAEQKLNALNKL